MFLDRRVEHAKTHGSGIAPARKIPVRQRRAVQVRGLPLGEILRVELAEIPLNKTLEQTALVGRNFGSDKPQDFVEPLHAAILVVCHCGVPLRWRLWTGANAPGADLHSVGIYLFVPIAMVGRG